MKQFNSYVFVVGFVWNAVKPLSSVHFLDPSKMP